MPLLLSISNLGVSFGKGKEKTVAVSNLSLDLRKGELLAIVGESGSGKSVTALSLLRLLPKQSTITGHAFLYRWEEQPLDLVQIPQSEINDVRGAEIAMIFQEPMTSLNPVFSCGYQVMESIRLHQGVNKKIARQKAIELFEQVKLPDPKNILKRYPHELSGGQKQRVMIAMAMSSNPALLIADEPTTALDVTVQKNILELIRQLQKKNNMGVIFITHDLGIVADIADKIVVMHKGEAVEQGIARDVLSDPKHPYTKALLACRPASNPKGKRLPVVSDFLGTDETPVIGHSSLAIEKSNDDELHIATRNPQTSDTRPPILQVSNLTVRFPVKRNLFGKAVQFFNAVDDVSFEVMPGDILGLVGESGCGKTTLGRAIMQLVRPTSGSIILNGEDISRIKSPSLRSLRKDFQIVFQDPYGSLNPRISIGEAILEPLKVHGMLNSNNERREKVIELLGKVNLKPDHFNRYPHQFSGGQRQRICIARALALEPKFLVFDESVSALDVSVQAQVLNLLSDLKTEFGFTSIFISHDLSVVHYICNRILVMQQGKIVEEGSADQVYYNPINEYTKKLVAAIPGKSLLKPAHV
ncbi:MAG TPA: ABC transporter ATP-binding protein [Ferruginibacter sp.]|nr:ABC transporter ATP-binding protein [Chitinophagaceae bacterium]HRI26170.1 ABC transporter ATP-binding protein [Ferruginibacter sp.]